MKQAAFDAAQTQVDLLLPVYRSFLAREVSQSLSSLT